MMKRFARSIAVMTVFAALAACVTVNIYFPAAEVNSAADTIVEDVYGEDASKDAPGKNGDSSALETFLAALLTPATAHAADATTISNATIRGLKTQIANNHQQFEAFYATGNLGIASDGNVTLRSNDGLSVKQIGSLKRLIKADSAARASLYREVAAALGTDQTAKVQEVFAAKWREKAHAGWWVQDANGAWMQK